MKRFKYADERISERDIMIAIPSIVIGVGILSMPKQLASVTIGADGWIPLLLVGLFAVFMSWAIAKFASIPRANLSYLRFQNRNKTSSDSFKSDVCDSLHLCHCLSNS